MYMLCMVGSGNGASKWAEMLIGHVWGGPVVGTTTVILPHYGHFVVCRPMAGDGRRAIDHPLVISSEGRGSDRVHHSTVHGIEASQFLPSNVYSK